MELPITLLVLIITTVILFWIWTRKVYSYWSNKGVETPPFSYIWGHLKTPFFQGGALSDRLILMYNYLKSRGLKHGGFYVLTDPWYVPTDLDICKAIIQTDFNHFVDRGTRVIDGDPLTTHLLNMKGNKWKLMRSKITPAFSSGRMKVMFEIMSDFSKNLLKVMDKLENEEVHIRNIIGRFTTDIISSCAFGLELNSLENPDNDFVRKGKAIFERPSDLWLRVYEKLFLHFPRIMKLLDLKYIRKDVTSFFVGITKETIDYREKNGVRRKDLMDLLIKLKNNENVEENEQLTKKKVEDKPITLDEVVGQAFLFFEAGFETSSAAITFALYELAANKNIQDKLRYEINEALKKYDDKITYDSIRSVQYLEMVIQEAIRKYPPIPTFRRICTKEYTIPGTDIVLEEGTRLTIPVIGIQHDPAYYPEPEKFIPERFTEENKKSRHPYAFLSFGDGPRMCIGTRFALMEARLTLINLLRRYEFQVSSRTKEPLQMDPKYMFLSVKGDIWLKYKRLC